MTDPHRSPGDSEAPPALGDDLKGVWSHFRAGNVVSCPMDHAPLALAVDASAGMYRFVCTQCGAASVWFESGPTGIRIRGASGHPSSDG